MSETTSLQTEAEDRALEPEAAAPPAEAPAAEAPAPAPDPTEAERVAAAKEIKKAEDVRKRINALTRRGAEAERERDALRAELAATKALIEARQPAGEEAQPPAQPAVTDDVIRARAEELKQAERIQERTRDLISKGAKELGADAWNEKTGILAEMGATGNPAFMQALAELPDAHKVVAHLADDLDALSGLLGRSPVAMAAEMGRIAAAIGTPAPRTLSAAPKPVAAVSGRATAEPNVYDDKLSMAEYVKLRQKTAPAHLGGEKRRRA